MYEGRDGGWIELICGSMFSGKSEELIRRVRRASYANQQIASFKPAIDKRYKKESIVSHNGTEVIAIPIAHIEEIFSHINPNQQPDVIAIDEVQFFTKEIVPVVTTLADEGIRLILAGLDTDFRGEPFGPMAQLLPLSDSITKLTAICPICGAPATRTQRLINEQPASYNDSIIMVGAKESYEPRCRKHHEVPGKPASRYKAILNR